MSLSDEILAQEPSPTFAQLTRPLKEPEMGVREAYEIGFRDARSAAAQLAAKRDGEHAQYTADLATELSARKWPVISRGVDLGAIQFADDAVREICRIVAVEWQKRDAKHAAEIERLETLLTDLCDKIKEAGWHKSITEEAQAALTKARTP